MIEYITPGAEGYCLTCEEFARLNHVKPSSVRERICRTGSFHGIKPRKLASRRLWFPAVQIVLQEGSIEGGVA